MAWSLNQQALQEKHPDLLRRLQTSSEAPSPPERSAAPLEEIDLAIVGRPVEPHRERVVIVFGLACGDAILELYRSRHSRLYRVILVEPDALAWLNWLHSCRADTMLRDTRVRLCMDSDPNTVLDLLHKDFVGLGIYGAQLFSSPKDTQKHEPFFTALRQGLETLATSAWDSRRLLNRQGELIQSNLIANIPRMMKSASVADMRNRIPGHAAIVVGAGPSLDRNVDELVRAPSHAMMIATDTAAPVLQQHGITPDWLVTCDPTTVNERHFHGLELDPQTIVAYLPETNPRVLAGYASHLRWVCLDNGESATLRYYLNRVEGVEPFPRGTNVGFCAYSVARLLGCDPIILAGLDLSMPLEGHTHVSGSANRCRVSIDETERSASYDGPIPVEDSPMLLVDGYYGEPVYTMPHFAETLHRLEWDIARAGRRVIDSTEGGAAKQGTERLPLAEAIQTLPPTGEWKEHLNQTIWPAVFSRPGKPASVLQRLHHDLQSILNESENARHAITQWAQTAHPHNDSEAYQKGAALWAARWHEFVCRDESNRVLDVALARIRFELDRTLPLTDEAPSGEYSQRLNQTMQWIEQFQAIAERILRLTAPAS